MDKLSMRVVQDHDGEWQLHLELQNEHFLGRGWFWVDPAALDKFAAELTDFPLTTEAALRLGYDDLKNSEDIILLVAVRPLGSLGNLEVRVEIANIEDPNCRLKAKLATNYANLDRLAPQLKSLASGKLSHAEFLGG